MAFAALDALREGYEVYPVVDAIGGTSLEAHRAGLERVVQAGAQPISWVSLACELQRDWARLETVPAIVEIVLTDRLLRGRRSRGRGIRYRRPSPARHSRLLLGGLERGRECRRRHQSSALESRWRDRVPRRGGDRRRGPVDQHAGRALRRRCGGADARPSRQRVPRGHQTRPSGPVRRIRRAAAAGRRRVARPDRSTRSTCLTLDGVSMMTNAGGSYLGDSRFDPIFAELQRRAGGRVRPSDRVARSDRAHPRPA